MRIDEDNNQWLEYGGQCVTVRYAAWYSVLQPTLQAHLRQYLGEVHALIQD